MGLPRRLLQDGLCVLMGGWVKLALCQAAPVQSCIQPVARVVSLEGKVEAQQAGESQPHSIKAGDTFCLQVKIWVRNNSRIALVLKNQTLLRLRANSEVWLDQNLKHIHFQQGSGYFLSRTPYPYSVDMPYVNAAIEGTEFLIQVDSRRDHVVVFEGRVVASNALGSITLGSGQAMTAAAGFAPRTDLTIRPYDAVAWALYYPAVMDLTAWAAQLPNESQADVQQLLTNARQGRYDEALRGLAELPDSPPKSLLQAAFELRVGQVGRAQTTLDYLLQSTSEPRQRAQALALQAVMALVRNDKAEALTYSAQAVGQDAHQMAAWLARSYVLQADFDLPGAEQAARQAMDESPESALPPARLAELAFMQGNMAGAEAYARIAVTTADPAKALAWRTLGYVELARARAARAIPLFQRAAAEDPGDPLNHLGLGLARIRQNHLAQGRRELEVAATLDPANSLIRSYLAKAYYEEDRHGPAAIELDLAKGLDPQDPTPWFYQALQEQLDNHPGAALPALRASIARNDQRAVYRSRLLLDTDLAARNVSLARIYQELGFFALADARAAQSLSLDPTNFSAHRFMADSYLDQPRHEASRLSELLQAQLWQPATGLPAQPQAGSNDLSLLRTLGPAQVGYQEYTPLFLRDGWSGQVSAMAGGGGWRADDLTLAALEGPLALSLGQFHDARDGYRPNNDQSSNILAASGQMSLGRDISIQLQAQRHAWERGDLPLYFYDVYSPYQRLQRDTDTLRLGLLHDLTPASTAILSMQAQDMETRFVDASNVFRLTDHLNSHPVQLEGQYVYRVSLNQLLLGAGHYQYTQNDHSQFETSGLLIPFKGYDRYHQDNGYLYGYVPLARMSWTLGLSYDSVDEKNTGLADFHRQRVNPKLGIVAQLDEATVLRVAAFQTVQREVIDKGTIEPAAVAGFAQFYDDANGAVSRRYGLGLDRIIGEHWFGGAELTYRKINWPINGPEEYGGEVDEPRIEQWHRLYLYLLASERWALRTEYRYEHIDQSEALAGNRGGTAGFTRVTTQSLPVGINYFHPDGWLMQAAATYYDQRGEFAADSNFFTFRHGHDQFCLFDILIGYRLPKSRGSFAIGVNNLLGRHFRFQETDPEQRFLYPERLLFGRMSWTFS